MGKMLGGGGGTAAPEKTGANSFESPSAASSAFGGAEPSTPTNYFQGGPQPYNDFQSMQGGGNFQLAQPYSNPNDSINQNPDNYKLALGPTPIGQQQQPKQDQKNPLADWNPSKISGFTPHQWQSIASTQFEPIQQSQVNQVAAPVIKQAVQGAINHLYPGQFNNLR